MKMTFRWFGENSDSVTLSQIKQIPGVSGLMGFLDYKAAGEVWTADEIAAYMDKVRAAGLECEVIESVNIHEDIKLGLPTRDRFIENYRQTIRNLAAFGVKVIIYNFMPVIDWLRTDLSHYNPEDGSYSMYFDRAMVEGLTPLDFVKSMEAGSNGFSLPGWEPERMAELKTTLELYKDMTPEILLENFRYFMQAILPVCEETGVKMACHPDDPAWRIFGLPRIGFNGEWLGKMVAAVDSPCNTLCICTGSLGSEPANDVPAIIRRFGSMGRVSCLHIRNIKFLADGVFREAAHWSGDGDLDMYEIVKAAVECCPEVYVRPDHGRMIWGETGRPGYGLYDRALGTQYIYGLWEAINKILTEEKQ